MTETLRVSFGGLAANKLRSGLTVLGLMIGVASVIVLIAVGTGSSAAVTAQIDALGSNVLLVQNIPSLGGLRSGGTTTAAQLTLAAVSALQDKFLLPDVASVSPVVSADSVTLATTARPTAPPRSMEPLRVTSRLATTRSHKAPGSPAHKSKPTAA